MADERLRFIFDVVGDKKAEAAFSNVGKAAGKAGVDGAAGAQSLTSKMGAFATKAAPYAAAASAVGAALLGAAMKFEDLAISAGKMSKATGLAIEDASRWIEVAGDVGIEAGTIETAFAKMDVALSKSPAKFAELGIEIAKTNSGAVDVNGTFLNVIDTLNGIQNPMERAEVAAKVFGKGFAGMAEITGLSADDLRTKLAAVSGQKVINEGEYAKAVKFRESMDKLKDSFEDVALKVGQAVMPVLEALMPVVEAVAVDVGIVTDAFMALLGVTDDSGWGTFLRVVAGIVTLGGSELARLFTDTSEAADGQAASLGAASLAWQDYKAELDAATVAHEKLAYARATADWNGSTDASREYRRAVADSAEAEEEAAKKADATAKALKKIEDAWRKLTGSLDAEQARLDFDEAFKNLPKNKQDVLDLKRAVVDYAMQFTKIPPSVVTHLEALIDAGDIKRAKELVDLLERAQDLGFTGSDGQGVGRTRTNTGRAASGGPRGGLTMVGEYGPELVALPSGSFVHSASQTQAISRGGYAPQPVVVNIHVAGSVVSEGQLVDQVHDGLLRKQRRMPLGLTS